MPRPTGGFLTAKPLEYVEEAEYGVFPTNPTMQWIGVVQSVSQTLDAGAEVLTSRAEGLLEAYSRGRVTNQELDRSVRQLTPQSTAYNGLSLFNSNTLYHLIRTITYPDGSVKHLHQQKSALIIDSLNIGSQEEGREEDEPRSRNLHQNRKMPTRVSSTRSKEESKTHAERIISIQEK